MRMFENRPHDLLRLYFQKERSSQLRPGKIWCRSRKLPYRRLEPASMDKVAASKHHEGVVMVVRPVDPGSVHTLALQNFRAQDIMVALDKISNTHNLGSIMRSCSYFGVRGLIAGSGEGQAAMTPSAARNAEGALEDVPVFQCSDLSSALREFKTRNVFVLGTDLKSGESLYETKVDFPCVLVLGNEQEGISFRVKKRCDAVVKVPGTGKMQSLNVAVAASVVLAELRRRASHAG